MVFLGAGRSRLPIEARMLRTILNQDFFRRPTLRVARDLIGKYLVRQRGSEVLAGRIVEVEAYIGPKDLACHASKGRTARTDVMFGAAIGTASGWTVVGRHGRNEYALMPVPVRGGMMISLSRVGS